MKKSNLHIKTFKHVLTVLLFSLYLNAPVKGVLFTPDGWIPTQAKLVVTDNLAAEEKELIIETSEWKIIMSLFYNGGICRLFDKVHDPGRQDADIK